MNIDNLWQDFKNTDHGVGFVAGLIVGLLVSYAGCQMVAPPTPIEAGNRELQSLRMDVDNLKSQIEDYRRILQEYSEQHQRNEESLQQDLIELHTRLDTAPDRRETK